MNKLLFIVLNLLLVTTLSAEPQKIKIGLISGLTGVAAKWSKFQNMGVTLAQEDYKSQGWDIEILVEDSQTQTTRAIAALNKLVEFDKVQSVISDDFGFVATPLIPIVNKRKIFLVSSGIPHNRYCKDNHYAFSISSQFFRAKEAFDRFFILNPQVRRMAMVIFDDQDWGDSYKNIWIELAKAHNVEIVADFITTEFTPDFRAALTKIISKKPDAIFFAHEPESFMKAVGQFHYSGLVVSTNAIFEMLVDKNIKRPEVEGVYTSDPNISEEFKGRFIERFGMPPILEAYAGYELLRTTVESFRNNPKNPELGIKKVAYDGLAGRIDFTSETCAGNITNWALFRFKNGQAIRQ